MSLSFKGISDGGFGGYELTDQLSYNLKWFIDWNLLNHGAYGIYLYDEVFNNTIFNNNMTTKNSTESFGIYFMIRMEIGLWKKETPVMKLLK